MIRKKIKIILLILPLVLCIGFWGNASFHRYQIDQVLSDAHGLAWKTNEKELIARVLHREDGELLEITIDMINQDNEVRYKKIEKIDRDMFGGGFVRAVQVDPDAEKEILVWHARNKYYLDFSNGNIDEIGFDKVPGDIRELAKDWHRYNIITSLEMTLIFLSSLCYYVLYFLVIGLVRLFDKRNIT